MTHEIKKLEDFLKIIPVVILLFLLLLALHYWKPSFYWNSFRTTTVRNLIGDRGTDILGYVAIVVSLFIWTILGCSVMHQISKYSSPK